MLPEMKRLWSHSGMYIGLLVLVTGMLYFPTFEYGFVDYEDPEYVTQNGLVLQGWAGPAFKRAVTSVVNGNWHPVTLWSHMSDVHWFGVNGGAHHRTNVLLHILNAVLFFFLLKRTTGRVRLAFFAAALFAWHPVQVEAVVWVAQRKTLLSVFLFLVLLHGYVAYVAKPSTMRYILLFLLFAVGLMAKPILVSVPLLLVAFDYWPLKRLGHVRKAFENESVFLQRYLAVPRYPVFTEKVPLLFLSFVVAWITWYGYARGGALVSAEVLPFDNRLANAAYGYTASLDKVLFPKDFALFYPLVRQSLFYPRVIASILALLCMTLWAVAEFRRLPFLLTGWFWFIVSMVPTVGILQVGAQHMADRYLYLPLLGLAMAMIWGFAQVLEGRLGKQLSLCVGGVALMVLIVLSGLQIRIWKNSETLFMHCLEKTEQNYFIENRLGAVLLANDKLDEAEVRFRKALEIHPGYSRAINNLGVLATRKENLVAARQYFEQAFEADPNNVMPLLNIGRLFAEQGRLTEALEYFRRAQVRAPDNAAANGLAARTLSGVGQVLLEKGEYDNARSALREALHYRPNHTAALTALAELEWRGGAVRKAQVLLQKAFVHAQEKEPVARQLVLLHEQLKQWPDAEKVYRYLLDLHPDEAALLARLAAVRYEREDEKEAAALYRKALQATPNHVAALTGLARITAGSSTQNLRDLTEARELIEQAATITENADPFVLEVLAFVRKESGDMEAAKRAIALARATAKSSEISDERRQAFEERLDAILFDSSKTKQ